MKTAFRRPPLAYLTPAETALRAGPLVSCALQRLHLLEHALEPVHGHVHAVAPLPGDRRRSFLDDRARERVLALGEELRLGGRTGWPSATAAFRRRRSTESRVPGRSPRTAVRRRSSQACTSCWWRGARRTPTSATTWCPPRFGVMGRAAPGPLRHYLGEHRMTTFIKKACKKAKLPPASRSTRRGGIRSPANGSFTGNDREAAGDPRHSTVLVTERYAHLKPELFQEADLIRADVSLGTPN